MALLPGRLECLKTLFLKFRLFGLSLTKPRLNKKKVGKTDYQEAFAISHYMYDHCQNEV